MPPSASNASGVTREVSASGAALWPAPATMEEGITLPNLTQVGALLLSTNYFSANPVKDASAGDAATGEGRLAIVPNLRYQGLYYGEEGAEREAGLASAARTASTLSSDLENRNRSAIMVMLAVTANPGGAQTLQLQLETWNFATDAPIVLAAPAASAFGGGAGVLSFCYGPGVGIAAAGTPPTGGAPLFFNGFLPRSYRVRVVHSGAGSWTYSVSIYRN